MHANTSTAAISADTSGAGAAPRCGLIVLGRPRGWLVRAPGLRSEGICKETRPGYHVDLYVDDSAWIYMATNLRLPEYSVVGAKLATKLKN